MCSGGRVRVSQTEKHEEETPKYRQCRSPRSGCPWSPVRPTKLPPIEFDPASFETTTEIVCLDLAEELPLDVILRMLFFLGVPQFSVISCVSSRWHQVASTDTLWREFYRERFNCEQRSVRREDAPPTLELSFATPASAREVTQTAPLSPRPRVVIRRMRSDSITSPTESVALSPSTPRSPRSFRSRYQRRLENPLIGDAVEVSWHGKFRLESCEVHAGCAWWAANIVDKLKLHDEHGDQWWYKVTFPGWQGRWDEWVPRERLRWPTRRVDPSLERPIKPRDSVEVWCSSKNVPGAWLEAKVLKIKNNKYLIGRAQTINGDPIWVDRSRIRLSPKEERRREQHAARNPILAKIGFCSPRRGSTINGRMPSFVGRGFVEADEPTFTDEADLLET